MGVIQGDYGVFYDAKADEYEIIRLFSVRRIYLFEMKMHWQVSGSNRACSSLSSPFSLARPSFIFPANRCTMDNQVTQQQQKDFYNALLADVGAERGNESHHPCVYGGAQPSPSSTMSPSDVPLNLDLVTQLIGLQGQQTGSMSQSQYSPQLVLEQRLKLNQLQQLQLQNQILQQQVRCMLFTFTAR